jgi:hypothetical protein
MELSKRRAGWVSNALEIALHAVFIESQKQ